MKMSRSKSVRMLQAQVCSKIGEMVHMSSAEVRQEVLPYFRLLFKTNKTFQLSMAAELELEDEEAAFILEEKIDSSAVRT